MSKFDNERTSLCSWDQCYLEFNKELNRINKFAERNEKNKTFQEV